MSRDRRPINQLTNFAHATDGNTRRVRGNLASLLCGPVMSVLRDCHAASFGHRPFYSSLAGFIFLPPVSMC